ncbi:putative methyltransferase-domain-containing protein [Dichotomocladium elegans]|nr:putative methyltransferase-domain-containing protein [Dichotomocladium elegans]
MADIEDQDFCLGNRPEGLSVKASDGPPEAWNQGSHMALKQDVDKFGLAGKIWQSAYMLPLYFGSDSSAVDPPAPIPAEYYVDDSTLPIRPLRIVELGAGTGYVGIWLANRLKHPAEIYITDLEQVLPLIHDNVAAHYKGDTGSNGIRPASIHVERLHWGNRQDGERILRNGPIDLVIVSDCVYFPELFESLTTTLRQITGPDTKVVIGYKCRSLEKETGFWQDHFGRYFAYEPVWKLSKKDNSETTPSGLLGEEEQMFVFVGKRRPDTEIKPADDTFTTLLFCNIMDF